MVYKILFGRYNEKKIQLVGDTMLSLLLMFTILFYLFSILFSQLHMDFLLSGICLTIVIVTFFTAKRFVKLLGGLFIVTGVYLLWTSHATNKDYVLSFGPMLELLVLFGLVPILAFPIKLGKYSDDIQDIIHQNIKKSKYLYMMTSSIAYFLSIFMNVATLPMTYYAIRPVVSIYPVQNEERFMSRAITHGFAMPLMWSPITPIVGVVISMTGVSWISILPYALPLSLLGIALDWYLGSKRARKTAGIQNDLYHPSVDETAVTMEGTSTIRFPFRILHIVLAIFLFNIVIITFDHFTNFSFLTLVSLLVIPFSFGWALLLKKGTEYMLLFKDYVKSFSTKMKDQFFIYLSAGFFISAIQLSKANITLNEWIFHMKDALGLEVFFFILPLIPIILAFIGLHPAVTLSLMAGALNPDLIGISPIILTILMLMGAVSAFLVGPYNTTIGLMSSIVKESTFKVSHWNMKFTLSYLLLGFVYVFMVRIIF
ncbi:hypothetical protein [Bacillus sp. 03113]|uniref:hypothetical protein n=1 Tax=Bacillus sp. 03113 TaxID=2578211 RepID=UPI00215D0FD4|nr:hypothetical protein [Bacillus sp. 03113]